MRLPSRSLLLLLVCQAFSCGEDAPREPTLDEYNAFIIDALCQLVLRCNVPDDDFVSARAVLKTEDRCAQYFGSVFQRNEIAATYEKAIAAGRMRFDGAAAAACKTKKYDCPALLLSDDESRCDNVFVGLVPAGAACRSEFECVAGTYCASETSACEGTCTARKPLGAPCDSDHECDQTNGRAECAGSNSLTVCTARAIAPSAKLGEPCGLLTGSGARAECDAELWCDALYQQQGTCRVPTPVGAACMGDDEPCAGQAFCIETDAGSTCQEVSVVPLNGDCDEGPDPQPRQCDPVANLHCVLGKCQKVGDGGVGSACLSDDLADSCRAGSYCDGDSETCIAKKVAGSPCDGSDQCEGSCDFEQEVCIEEACLY